MNEIELLSCKFLRNKFTTISHNYALDQESQILIIYLLTNEFICSKIEDFKQVDSIILKGISSNAKAIAVYYYPIKMFVHYLKNRKIKKIKFIDTELVIEFLNLYTDRLSPTTARSYRQIILSFLNFVEKSTKVKIDVDLTSYKRNPIAKNIKYKYYLSKKEFKIFITNLKNYRSDCNETIFQTRNKLMILIICYTGMRSFEVISLRKNSIRLNGEYYEINIKGKGGKERVAFIKSNLICEELAAWLIVRKKILSITNSKSDLLFFNKHIKQVRHESLYVFMNKILHISRIRKIHNGTHLLRHTFATILYEKTKDLLLVNVALGHSHIQTTVDYISYQNFIEKLRKVLISMNDSF